MASSAQKQLSIDQYTTFHNSHQWPGAAKVLTRNTTFHNSQQWLKAAKVLTRNTTFHNQQ